MVTLYSTCVTTATLAACHKTSALTVSRANSVRYQKKEMNIVIPQIEETWCKLWWWWWPWWWWSRQSSKEIKATRDLWHKTVETNDINTNCITGVIILPTQTRHYEKGENPSKIPKKILCIVYSPPPPQKKIGKFNNPMYQPHEVTDFDDPLEPTFDPRYVWHWCYTPVPGVFFRGGAIANQQIMEGLLNVGMKWIETLKFKGAKVTKKFSLLRVYHGNCRISYPSWSQSISIPRSHQCCHRLLACARRFSMACLHAGRFCNAKEASTWRHSGSWLPYVTVVPHLKLSALESKRSQGWKTKLQNLETSKPPQKNKIVSFRFISSFLRGAFGFAEDVPIWKNKFNKRPFWTPPSPFSRYRWQNPFDVSSF